jgi:Holliday junction resolvasome RuvABC endonuclease subunit
MKVLSLDLSTKTGYAFFHMEKGKCKIIKYGTLKSISKPKGNYPCDYIDWSDKCSNAILEIWEEFNPEILVIEETAKGARNSFTQKILEWIHKEIAEEIKLWTEEGNLKGYKYYLTEEWRRIAGCKMTSEELKHNAKRSRRKAKAKKENTSITVIKDKEGKRLGRITKKHVTIRRINEVFNLNLILKDEDAADALGLGYAYYVENYE